MAPHGIGLNNNVISETALLDQFNATTYITIGDEYTKSGQRDPRYKGKQFSGQPPKKGRTNDTLFQNAYLWLYEKEQFKDSPGYRETQPLENRKMGFWSHDAKRRDEYTLHVKVEQYREQLRKEDKFAKKFNQTLAAKALKAGKLDPNETKARKTETKRERMTNRKAKADEKNLTNFEGPEFLFDIGRPDGTTKYCMKCPRDTFFCKHTAAEYNRDYGDFRLSSQTVGWGSDDIKYEKSRFSRMPIIRDSFFRRTGII